MWSRWASGRKDLTASSAKAGAWSIKNLDRIFNLTMNLLAYSKPRKPKLEMVHPRKVIDDCLELIAPVAAERGVMAMADIDKRRQPPIPIDVDGMHQVLMNLLTNALDARRPQEMASSASPANTRWSRKPARP